MPPIIVTTKMGAGLVAVLGGSLALSTGGLGWDLFGVIAIGFGAVLFVKGYRESHD